MEHEPRKNTLNFGSHHISITDATLVPTISHDHHRPVSEVSSVKSSSTVCRALDFYFESSDQMLRLGLTLSDIDCSVCIVVNFMYLLFSARCRVL